MIHRRQRPDASSTSQAQSPASATNSTPNAAYMPLRRPAPLAHGNGYGGGSGSIHSMSGVSSFSGQSSFPGSTGAYGSRSPFGLESADNEVLGPSSVRDMVVRARDQIRTGVKDAVRLDRSWGLVWGDTELRTLVLKLTLLNLLSLTLLSLFPLVLGPILHGHGDAAGGSHPRAQQVSLWYNVLLSWPTFAVVYGVNAFWGQDVARRAHTMLHPAHRHQPSSSGGTAAPTFSDDPGAWTWNLVTRLLLIADFTLVFRIALLVPIFGWPIALGYMTLINAYYSFEWIFVSRAWALGQRCTYISERAAYMFGFGLPATLLTTFGSPLLNMAIFTLIYPFLLIQALQARPPATAAILGPPASPSTPTTPSSESGTPHKASPSWLKYAHVPVFFFARHTLTGSRFLVDAVMRERGGYAARRRGKRAQ